MSQSKVIITRKIKPRLSLKIKHKLNRPLFRLKPDVLEEFMHADELASINHLDNDLIKKDKMILFYPGCGLDILQPIIYSTRLTTAKDLTFVLADKEIDATDITSLILQLTGNHNFYTKKVDKHTEKAVFTFNDLKITIICKSGNILKLLPKELKHGYDIYFERAFELFRTDNLDFMQSSIYHLNKGGLLITDAGLIKVPRQLKRLKVAAKAKPLGFYNNLSIFKKD